MESRSLTFSVMTAIYKYNFYFAPLRQKETYVLEAEDLNLDNFDLESYL